MSTAERKVELVKMIIDADEATTGKLIDFVKSLEIEANEFSEKDLAEFTRRRAEYLINPDSAIPWQESLSHLRNKLTK